MYASLLPDSDDIEWKKKLVSSYGVFSYMTNIFATHDERVLQGAVISIANLTMIEVCHIRSFYSSLSLLLSSLSLLLSSFSFFFSFFLLL
jgi:hypothetical protein